MLLSRAIGDLLGNRRRGGALAREEFAYVTMLNWLHLTVDIDTSVVVDLQATASNPADRLGALGQKVGITPALRSRELFDLSEPMSTLLRGIELGLFDTEATATTLFTDGTNIFRDVLDVINNWQSATGERVKERPRLPAARGLRHQCAAAAGPGPGGYVGDRHAAANAARFS